MKANSVFTPVAFALVATMVTGGQSAFAQQDRVSATEKGSLLFYSKVDIRWSVAGAVATVVQDTWIQLSNDNNQPTLVQMYFVNGDEPLAAVGTERAHPGWNWVDVLLPFTQNEPRYWSALTGLPAGVSPFTVLDPGFPPGRPDPDGSTDRVLRGFIIAFAVDNENRQIKWNHLFGQATIVNYTNTDAWEYNAWAFQVVASGATGSLVGTPGSLKLNGVEYSQPFSDLFMNFQAVGSTAFSRNVSVSSDSDLTLHVVSADLRQETDGPITTKASFDIWNQAEFKLSGQDRCVTCWDERLLSNYPAPNHFLLLNLGSSHGKARIDGLYSQLCNVLNPNYNPDLPTGPGNQQYLRLSEPAALLGVLSKHLTFVGAAGNALATAGGNLFGGGTESAEILFDLVGGPPENPNLEPPAPTNARELTQFIDNLVNERGSRSARE